MRKKARQHFVDKWNQAWTTFVYVSSVVIYTAIFTLLIYFAVST